MASTPLVHLLRSARLLTGALTCCSILACAGGELDGGSDGSVGATDETGELSTDDLPTDDLPMGDGDGDGNGDGDGEPCTLAGCGCASVASCDPGLDCLDGVCSSATCGNGIVEPPEECDDGNDFEGDGCNTNCKWTMVEAVVAGAYHTCALIENGRIRCWGLNHVGQLGYGNANNIGDNEDPATAGDVLLGEKVQRISVGYAHACAHLVDGNVRCWGWNGSGQLGLGNFENIGDNEHPFSIDNLNINASILDIAAGGRHTCALVGAGKVRCWGEASSGQLGYGNTTSLPIPLTADLNLGSAVTVLRTGVDHNCALLDDGKVRCWGRNNRGQLGYGHMNNIGDDETPGSVVPVPIAPQGLPDGTAITDIALADDHSCVLYETGDVLCWGYNFYGQIGQGHTSTIGDNETLAVLFPIKLGGKATALALGRHHTCALLTDGGVKCWGRNVYGQLGRGDIAHIGDTEVPEDIGAIELGGVATSITAGDFHTCAVVDGHRVMCWGFNDYGQLGYGDTELRGVNELPVEAGSINLL